MSPRRIFKAKPVKKAAKELACTVEDAWKRQEVKSYAVSVAAQQLVDAIEHEVYTNELGI